MSQCLPRREATYVPHFHDGLWYGLAMAEPTTYHKRQTCFPLRHLDTAIERQGTVCLAAIHTYN